MNSKKGLTVTLDEASRISDKISFSALTKPVGSLCNLDCKYCYYLDKERFYGEAPKLMSDEVLNRYIKEYIQSNEVPEVMFNWHGGEPLMAGIDFYKKVIILQKEYNIKNIKISNSIQTNGTLLNEEWCSFFKKNNFLVGVSIDGPEDIYTTYRYNKAGNNIFKRVLNGIKLLKKYGVDFNTLSVVNKMSEGRGREIYLYLKSLGVEFMQFLPSVDYVYSSETYTKRSIISPFIGDGENQYTKAEWSVSAVGYGQFLIDIFDEWIKQDVGTIFVQIFDMALSSWCGQRPPVCAYQESCGEVLAIEHNGDAYTCDHFVFPQYKLGNIMETPIKEMLRSSQQLEFGLMKRDSLSRECKRCKYYFACCGECPKHRHIPTSDGKFKYSLCDGVKMFYEHIDPYMTYMTNMLQQKKAPAMVMLWARQRAAILAAAKTNIE